MSDTPRPSDTGSQGCRSVRFLIVTFQAPGRSGMRPASASIPGNAPAASRRTGASDAPKPTVSLAVSTGQARARVKPIPPNGSINVAIDKVGRLAIRTVTAQTACPRRRCEQAGVASCSPRDLRRTFVTDMLAADNDLATVQRPAGHASPQTTARYDRSGEEAMRRAATKLLLP